MSVVTLGLFIKLSSARITNATEEACVSSLLQLPREGCFGQICVQCGVGDLALFSAHVLPWGK